MKAKTKAQRRESARQRYAFRCGYCGLSEDERGAQLTIDHYRPRSHGGRDDDENIVYCCPACNERKGDYWSEDTERRLLHPLRDDLAAHLVKTSDHIFIALTERGNLHLSVMRLNGPPHHSALPVPKKRLNSPRTRRR